MLDPLPFWPGVLQPDLRKTTPHLQRNNPTNILTGSGLCVCVKINLEKSCFFFWSRKANLWKEGCGWGEWCGSGAVTRDWRAVGERMESRDPGRDAEMDRALPLCSQQMPECDSQLANNRAEEAEGKRHSWGVRPSDRGAEGGRAGPSWDTRGLRRGVGVADG